MGFIWMARGLQLESEFVGRFPIPDADGLFATSEAILGTCYAITQARAKAKDPQEK
jgi:hypothetical protein